MAITAATSSRTTTMSAFPLVAYLVLAYALSWLILVPAGLGLLPDGSAGVLYNLAPFGPAVAAFVVTAITAGRPAVGHLNVSVDSPEKLPPLSAAVEVAAYRIAREALTNVARHAGAQTCAIALALEAGVLCLKVRDDGSGMPEPQDHPPARTGVGLTSMRERATELGGSLFVESLPEGGTRVLARLPLPGEE